MSILALVAALQAVLAGAASLEVQVRDSTGMPVADTAVYAVPASGGVEAKGKSASIEQLDREFVPYVSVVQVGTSVRFPNRDPILHHVYSFSPAKSFEIRLYSGKSPSEIVFDRSGVVTLGCNIHDWMIGHIVVVPTPHFARTDSAGVARIRGLPAGSYEVRAWHPQQRAAAAPSRLSFEATTQARLAFVVDAAPRKAKYKPPLDRARY